MTHVRAGLYVLGATFIFAVIFASGRFTLDLASAFQIMFLRFAGGFVTVIFLALMAGETWTSMQSQNRRRQTTRALAGGLGGSAMIFGNMHMPLVDANAIGLLSVVFAVLMGAAFLGERLTPRQFLGGVVCLVGALIVLSAHGAFQSLNAAYLVPAAVVTLGALLLAVESVHIKLLTTVDRPLVTLAHANLFGALLLAVPACLTWQSADGINLALLCLGPLAILGQYSNIRGYSLAPVSILAPLSYSKLLFAGLLGWVFFQELPSTGAVIGAALLVMGGTTIMLSRSSQKH